MQCSYPFTCWKVFTLKKEKRTGLLRCFGCPVLCSLILRPAPFPELWLAEFCFDAQQEVLPVDRKRLQGESIEALDNSSFIRFSEMAHRKPKKKVTFAY